MSLNQMMELLGKSINDEPTDEEKRLLRTYFNIDDRDLWTKYKEMFPNMFPCIINNLVMEELLSKCKNRGERRQLLKDIKCYNKKNKI